MLVVAGVVQAQSGDECFDAKRYSGTERLFVTIFILFTQQKLGVFEHCVQVIISRLCTWVSLLIVFIHSQILEAADKIQAIDMKKRSLKIIVSNFHKVSSYSYVVMFSIYKLLIITRKTDVEEWWRDSNDASVPCAGHEAAGLACEWVETWTLARYSQRAGRFLRRSAPGQYGGSYTVSRCIRVPLNSSSACMRLAYICGSFYFAVFRLFAFIGCLTTNLQLVASCDLRQPIADQTQYCNECIACSMLSINWELYSHNHQW